MKRRTFLVGSGLVSSSLLGGCLGNADSNPSTSGDKPTDSEPSTSDEYSNSRLRVQSLVDGELTANMQLTALDDDRVLHEDTYSFTYGDEVELDDKREPGVDARFEIEIGGESVFSRKIYNYEGCKLAIQSRTEVEVTSHSEV